MWIKVVIVFLFIALCISLFTGLGFVLKNKGEDQQNKAAWYSLTVRLILVTLLMGFLIYGVYTGQLGSKAPWDMRRAQPPAPMESQPSPQPDQ